MTGRVLDTLRTPEARCREVVNRDLTSNPQLSLHMHFMLELSRVSVTLLQTSGEQPYLMKPYRMSKIDLFLLHGTFVYTDTRATIDMPTVDGEMLRLQGHVRACRVIEGRIHEVHIRLSDPVDVGHFVSAPRPPSP